MPKSESRTGQVKVNREGSEFDLYADAYESLLEDPLRSHFAIEGANHFHARKRDVILGHFRRRRIDPHVLDYLDVGCGRGELLHLLQDSFKSASGCDSSIGMLEGAQNKLGPSVVRHQPDPTVIPFDDAEFDFVTAVCVYHHVPPKARRSFTAEILRVLRPGGVLAIIEHNPFNPITKLIVSRTPVDASAVLLKPAEVRRIMREQGLVIDDERFFLYLPQRMYKPESQLEAALHRVPLGGQYATFGTADPCRL